MKYVAINDNMLVMMRSLEASDLPLTIDNMVGWAHNKTDRADLLRLWFAGLIVVAPGPNQDQATIGAPFHYSLTEAGLLRLKKIREGESADRFDAAMDKMHASYEEVVVVEDPGQGKRWMAIVMTDGTVDYEETRWVYLSGTTRRPQTTEVDTLLETR